MSEDIVERLRNPRIDACVNQDMNEAAREIERLRATHSNDGVIITDARALITELRATIEKLRSVSGAVSPDAVTFDQIKKDQERGQRG